MKERGMKVGGSVMRDKGKGDKGRRDEGMRECDGIVGKG